MIRFKSFKEPLSMITLNLIQKIKFNVHAWAQLLTSL